MSYDISNKTILITGANRGIGKVIAEAFLDQGAARLYAAVRNLESAEPLVAAYGDRVVPVQVDMTDEASINAAAAIATDVEIVINNAGVLGYTSIFADDAMQTLDFELNINLYGLMYVARAFAPILKANGGGALVQLNSLASVTSVPELATYCASKHATYAITQSLRKTLAEQGTHVVSVHPGPIATDMAKGTFFEEMGEPPSLVADSIIEALNNNEFLVFPDSMAKEVGSAYQDFAENVIMA